MINGESYKRIVAEAAKLALGDDNIIERCFIVELLLDANVPNQIAGAVGFSVRENKVYIIKCKTMMVACGGAVNIYQPRSVGEGKGRAWYPVWNAGSTYTMAMKVGAELTMMENRFTPARFKDGYGPVGAWFLLFKAKTLNGLGENFAASDAAKAELEKYAPYGTAAITPTCLRNHLMLFEMKEGRGPIMMDTVTALAELGRNHGQERAQAPRVRSLGRLPRHDLRPGQPVVCHRTVSRRRKTPKSCPPSLTCWVPTPAAAVCGPPARIMTGCRMPTRSKPATARSTTV
jgi:succinate dehydrogenase/fumarate reductase flavoprotein subunit